MTCRQHVGSCRHSVHFAESTLLAANVVSRYEICERSHDITPARWLQGWRFSSLLQCFHQLRRDVVGAIKQVQRVAVVRGKLWF